jgi:predicted DNA-binding transcriptional regulator AlpA
LALVDAQTRSPQLSSHKTKSPPAQQAKAQSVPASELAQAQSSPVANEVEAPPRRRRWISREKLLEKVGDTSYPKIWDLMRQGAFPRPYYIGTKPVWDDDEVDQLMEKLPREPQKQKKEVK